MMYLTNKYTKWYFNIINKTDRDIIGYCEIHHILPRSLGGSDDPSNLIKLSAREHFICHWLLSKMTTGIDQAKMYHALWGMRRIGKGQLRYSTPITARVYEVAKIQRSKILSEAMAGSGNPMYGRSGWLAPCYGRTGDKHPNFGKKMSPESSLKKSLASRGVPKSAESNKKRSIAHTGKKHEYAMGDLNVMRRPEILAKCMGPRPKFKCHGCGRTIANTRQHSIICSSDFTPLSVDSDI